MPVFLEEDGTGVEDATSYASLVFAEAYMGAAWAADDTAKEAALMAASEYADARWGAKLQSRPLVPEQGLELPRVAMYNRYGIKLEGVPDDWKKAICLYAQQSVAGTLYPSASPTTSKDVKRKKTVVGPITTEVEYQGSNTSSSWLQFPLPDKLIRQYINSGGGVIRN